MFWFKKKNSDKQKKAASTKGAPQASYRDVGTKGQRSSAEIRAEALANARAARERVGEETIQKIAAALVQKQMSLTEQAKSQIAKHNATRVVDEIRFLMDDKGDGATRH